jgi:hypothetical protein
MNRLSVFCLKKTSPAEGFELGLSLRFLKDKKERSVSKAYLHAVSHGGAGGRSYSAHSRRAEGAGPGSPPSPREDEPRPLPTKSCVD